jgi:uridine kinase
VVTVDRLVGPLVERLRSLVAGAERPVFVALDGRSGSGKSTLAVAVRDAMGTVDGRPVVTVIDGDGFYAGGSPATWDRRSAADKADSVIDWRRQRQVLEALRDHGVATWHPFDWESDDWDADDPPLSPEVCRCESTGVVLLEGAYSGRPELADLLSLRVLLDVATEIRRAQLLEREGDGYRTDWEQRWSEAEDLYFGTVMTPDRFDLVLRRPGSNPTDPGG